MASKPITVIDRYLIWQFLQLFVMCYVSLAGLYTVVDAFTNLESFLQHAEKHGSLAKIMLRFYAFRWVAFFDLTSGVLALIAAMFTITLFQSRNEMTALLAAGISKRRICRGVFLAAAGVALATAAAREFVMPRYSKELSQNAKDLSGEALIPISPTLDPRSGILLHGGHVTPKNKSIKKPNFHLPDDGLLDRYGRYLSAEEAFYRPPTDERPGGYLLRGAANSSKWTDKPPLIGRGGEPVVLFPGKTAWLKPDECFVISDVEFEQLSGQSAWRNQSTAELVQRLRSDSVDYGADVKVAIHSRVVKPVLDLTLLMLGLPLVLSRDNRNIFLAVAICLGVTTVFLIAVYSCQYLGSSVYLSPQLAAWLPLLIFVPVAAGMARPLLE